MEISSASTTSLHLLWPRKQLLWGPAYTRKSLYSLQRDPKLSNVPYKFPVSRSFVGLWRDFSNIFSSALVKVIVKITVITLPEVISNLLPCTICRESIAICKDRDCTQTWSIYNTYLRTIILNKTLRYVLYLTDNLSRKIIHTMVVSRQTADALVTQSYMFNNKGVNYDHRNCNELKYSPACVCVHTSGNFTDYRLYLLKLYRTRKKNQKIYWLVLPFHTKKFHITHSWKS